MRVVKEVTMGPATMAATMGSVTSQAMMMIRAATGLVTTVTTAGPAAMTELMDMMELVDTIKLVTTTMRISLQVRMAWNIRMSDIWGRRTG